MTEQDAPRFAAVSLAMFKAFGRSADKDIANIMFQGLKHMTFEDASKCIELAIMNEEKFPTVFAVKRYVSMIPRKELRLEHKPVVNVNLADDARKLMDLSLSGKITREQIIEGMMVMEKKYPGIGWTSEAAKLAHFYEQNESGDNNLRDDLKTLASAPN